MHTAHLTGTMVALSSAVVWVNAVMMNRVFLPVLLQVELLGFE